MASNHVQLFSWHGVLGLQMNEYRFAVRYPLKNPTIMLYKLLTSNEL